MGRWISIFEPPRLLFLYVREGKNGWQMTPKSYCGKEQRLVKFTKLMLFSQLPCHTLPPLIIKLSDCKTEEKETSVLINKKQLTSLGLNFLILTMWESFWRLLFYNSVLEPTQTLQNKVICDCSLHLVKYISQLFLPFLLESLINDHEL